MTGTLRRAALEHALHEGDSELARSPRNHEVGVLGREALGAIHPQLRSGEDLRPGSRDEVEIARITLDSVHGEVTSIRARLRSGRILYVAAVILLFPRAALRHKQVFRRCCIRPT